MGYQELHRPRAAAMTTRRRLIQSVFGGVAGLLLFPPRSFSWPLIASSWTFEDDVVLVDGWVLLRSELAAVLG
jgi:hypothetical protein